MTRPRSFADQMDDRASPWQTTEHDFADSIARSNTTAVDDKRSQRHIQSRLGELRM